MAEVVEIDRNAEELTEPEEVDSEKSTLDDEPLPHGTEEDGEDKGYGKDWLYTLQFPLAEGTPAPDFQKVRIPAVIYGRDIRNSGKGKNETEVVFYMLCSMGNVPTDLMDRVDARDYVVLQQLVSRRALKNSRAVLRSLSKGG